jgi:hypothetical protein
MNFGKPEQEFQRGRRNNPYECEPVDYRLFTYRQKIVDKRIISTYASSGDLPVLGIRDEPDYVDKPDLCRLASFIEALVHSFEN